MTDEEYMKEINETLIKARKIYREGMAAINNVMLDAIEKRITEEKVKE